MTFGQTLILLAVGSVLFVAVAIMIGTAKEKKTAAAISRRIDAEHQFISAFDQSCIGLNFAQQKIVLGRGERVRTIPFSNILKVDLVRDDNVVTTRNRGSQAVGALVGGVAFGPVGALVGALSGKSHSRTSIRKLALRISTTSNSYSVTFLDVGNTNTDRSGIEVFCLSEAERFYALVLSAMQQSTTSEIREEFTALPQTNGSADEIQKLWELKEKGAISADEYARAKIRLLGAPPA